MAEFKKRETAYKLKIGDILRGVPIVEDIPQEVSPDPSEKLSGPAIRERFRFLELDDKRIMRVNIIANIIDKYQSEGDKKFASVTLDDATGQIKLKVFGEDVNIFDETSQGDTVLVIGVLRSYNKELYILPEIVKKADPRYLLVRKLELDKSDPKAKLQQNNEKKLEVRDQIIDIIRSSSESGGVATEELILKIKTADPETINHEVIRLIEEGMIYEPRPGRVRWLG